MVTLIKWVLILGLGIGGAIFLAQGIGIRTFLAQYEASQTRDILAGLLFLGIGFAMAAFWKVESRPSIGEFDGESPRSRRIVKVERNVKEPK
ncbi:MAG: hypothetical protein ACLQBJ_04790 [Bryobacteraceae bacterium]